MSRLSKIFSSLNKTKKVKSSSKAKTIKESSLKKVKGSNFNPDKFNNLKSVLKKSKIKKPSILSSVKFKKKK